MVFFCLSEDCFDCNSIHSMDGHFPAMEAHSSGREYQNRNSISHGSKGQAPTLPHNQTSGQIPISMSQSAISSQHSSSDHHHQQQKTFSSSSELDDRYNERYLDKYNVSNDSCKQVF